MRGCGAALIGLFYWPESEQQSMIKAPNICGIKQNEILKGIFRLACSDDLKLPGLRAIPHTHNVCMHTHKGNIYCFGRKYL